ncbi:MULTISPECIES: hypothetical protein [unclassified Psychrobacillus]|uniref:hypothetical protein n=1 Tax=unclassified Psychrobacillus TaxID=2636677 RepID=UPI0030F4D847
MEKDEKEYIAPEDDLLDFQEADDHYSVEEEKEEKELDTEPLETETQEEESPKLTFLDKLETFYSSYKMWLFVIGGIILMLLLAVSVSGLLQSTPDKEDTPLVVLEQINEEKEQVVADEKAATADSPTALQLLLTSIQVSNNTMVTQSMSNITYIEQYRANQANKIGLESHLRKSLREKQIAQTEFLQQENAFDKQGMSVVFHETAERNEYSVDFTTQLIEELVGGTKNFERVIESHRQIDSLQDSSQLSAIIRYLEKQEISYSEENGKVFVQ